MIEVEVRNFQSIDRATFRIDGFTVIVGRSNIGKSALVRAVRAALTGASASGYVRHGAACLRRVKGSKTCKCYASVHLRGKDFDLLWEKGDALNRYTFNGQVFDKAERGTPEFLQPAFSPIRVGDRSETLQVSDQFNPIFLLDQSGGAVADTLSDVAHLDRINEAIRLVERDRKDTAATRKVREKDVTTLATRIESYAGLDDTLLEVQRMADQQGEIERSEASLLAIESYLERASSVTTVIKSLQAATLVEVPDTALITSPVRHLDELADFDVRLSRLQNGIASLEGVDEICLPSPQGMKETASRLAALNGWVGRAVDVKGWLSPAKAVEDATVPSSQTLRDTYGVFSTIGSYVVNLGLIEESVSALERQLAAVMEEERAVRSEQDALGVCPTCVRPVAVCGGVD